MNDMAYLLIQAQSRNPDAYHVIGAISGMGEKRVREIAEEKVEPSIAELYLLRAYANF